VATSRESWRISSTCLAEQARTVYLSTFPSAANAGARAATWFADHRRLFICDDLWENEANKKTDFSSTLNQPVDSHQTNAPPVANYMLFSTRSRDIEDLVLPSGRVLFDAREPGGQEAVRMLCAHAEQNEEGICGIDETRRDALAFVLEHCAGLPVALAIAGRAIASSVNRVDVQTAAGTARNFAPLLRHSRNRFRGSCLPQKRDMLNEKYPILDSAFEASSTSASKWSDICVMDDILRRRIANGAMCTAETNVGAPADVKVALVSSHRRRRFSCRTAAVNEMLGKRRVS
jgi:hypothetical protein